MIAARHHLSTLRQRFPRAAHILQWLRPRYVWRRLRLVGRDRQQVFTYIYQNRLWNSVESVSGSGSTMEATLPLREHLPEILASLGARSLLDAPCGDYHWMKEVALDLDLYIGGDIVAPLVDRLNERYGDGSRRFVHLDVTCDMLPGADVFLCRDCLLHLSNWEVLNTLDNAVRSSCSYLMASTYPDCAYNTDIRTGFSRPLNLCLSPFDLPEPVQIIADPGGAVGRKCLGVWDLRQIRGRSNGARPHGP